MTEPVSRDHILRYERGQGNINFPSSADHEQVGNPLIFTICCLKYIMTMYVCRVITFSKGKDQLTG